MFYSIFIKYWMRRDTNPHSFDRKSGLQFTRPEWRSQESTESVCSPQKCNQFQFALKLNNVQRELVKLIRFSKVSLVIFVSSAMARLTFWSLRYYSTFFTYSTFHELIKFSSSFMAMGSAVVVVVVVVLLTASK